MRYCDPQEIEDAMSATNCNKNSNAMQPHCCTSYHSKTASNPSSNSYTQPEDSRHRTKIKTRTHNPDRPTDNPNPSRRQAHTPLSSRHLSPVTRVCCRPHRSYLTPSKTLLYFSLIGERSRHDVGYTGLLLLTC